MGPQTLRLYERRGLLTPSRTDGGTRRYSDDDLERLRRITELVDQGVNLAGIAHILDLETRNSQLESDYTQLEVLNARLKADQRPTPGRNATSKERRRDSVTAPRELLHPRPHASSLHFRDQQIRTIRTLITVQWGQFKPRHNRHGVSLRWGQIRPGGFQ